MGHPKRQGSLYQYLRPARILIITLMLSGNPALAWDYDLRGYLGYALVDAEDNFECDNRACQGVFEDSLFYGLSLITQGDYLGAQVVVSQDEEEDPDISIAQLTWRQPIFGGDLDLQARGGKIIVPLGLFGSQRITPTTQPGLAFPQAFLLNAYYDLLTLSDYGLGIDVRSYTWGFKAAVYEPQSESVEQVVVIPGSSNPLDLLLGILLGGQSPGPQTTVVRREQDNKAAYIGFDYRDENYVADFGWIGQELDDVRVDAFNVGIQTTIGQFQPSIEAFELDLEGVEDAFQGISINLLYSAERWQTFLSGVNLDIGRKTTQELVIGGVYYWDNQGRLSSRLNLHRIDGDFPGITAGNDNATAYTLAVAYSWD